MENNELKIILAGFSLEPAEKAIVGNIIANYKHKICERGGCDYVRLRLRKSQKGKAFMHEIEGRIKSRNKIFNSKVADYNLFAALDSVLEKLLNELIHNQRTARQRK